LQISFSCTVLLLRYSPAKGNQNWQKNIILITYAQHYHVESVNIVKVAVLPATSVSSILVHRDLRSVEHRRLVHVVPREKVACRADVILRQKPSSPVMADSGIHKIQPRGRTCKLHATVYFTFIIHL